MREATWNTRLAFRMWCEGLTTLVIGERVGVKPDTLKKYARENGWPKRRFRNHRIMVDPVKLPRRCPGCLAIYESTSALPHCDAPSQSIYEVAA